MRFFFFDPFRSLFFFRPAPPPPLRLSPHITSPLASSFLSPPAVAFSFNGGKDSTVILHLLRAAVAQRRREETEGSEGDETGEPALSASGLRAFVFDRPGEDFPAVTAFVAEADAAHGLGLEHLSLEGVEGGMAGALSSYLHRTGVKAVLLGTRRGDPNAGGQAEFCPSSPGWPPFLRVNPILDWGFGDVWAFLDGLGAPSCPLYSHGFTSLGSVGSTAPNAALLRPDGSYAPARELVDGRQERAGRGKGKGTTEGRGGVSASTRPPSAPTRTAAVLLVGDELLAARVPDA